ncbi:MAG: glycosyltransferase family 4 protein [Proteobacteria bacterium]|nr:glycosyltransferase family 4 protein [Pseudomonadota bacterium]
MKIFYFSRNVEIEPASRYRIYQYLPFLTERGVRVEIRPLFREFYFWILRLPLPLKVIFQLCYCPYRFAIRAFRLLGIRDADLVVIKDQLFPYLPYSCEKVFLRKAKRLGVDLDDAIYLTPLHGRKLGKILGDCQFAVVGNKHLAEYAARYNRKVYLVPTVVNTERIGARTDWRIRDPGGVVTIGWIGLAYNLNYLRDLEEALRELSKKFPIALKVVSSRGVKMRGVDVVYKKWSLAEENDDVQGFDLGIMPLRDDEWSRGKCGLKLIQYMAAGVPVVASPVGVNAEIVRDGQNGFWARNPAEWVEKLSILCQNEELRRGFGMKGRETVEKSFSLSAWAPKLDEIYQSVYRDKCQEPGG